MTRPSPNDGSDDSPHGGRLVAGSDAPERTEVRIGFMPLTDCAPVIMATELGFDRKHGVRIVPTREASWAAARDKLLNGQLDLAHALYGLVYGVHLGLSGPRRDMAVLMTLSRNGQGITLSRDLTAGGVTDLRSLAATMRRRERAFTFAQTFPTGTHALWLYYWLASAGIHPFDDARCVVIPPPQMIEAMRAGQVDGFSAGEPWNQLAIDRGVGATVATSQEIWPDHPEKVLGATAAFCDQNPHTARAVAAAVLEASRWIEASPEHLERTAATLARPEYVNAPAEALAPRLMGRYDNGLGRRWQEAHAMRFYDDGAVNFPYLSDGMWFLTQYRRWGWLDAPIDYAAIARSVHRTDLYRDAATALGISTPTSELRSSELLDGIVWDGRDPEAYARRFAVRRDPRARTAVPAA